MAVNRAIETVRLRTQLQQRIENEQLLRLAMKGAQAGSWDWDLVTSKLTWSAETFALYGLEPDGGLPDYEDWHNQYLHPDDRSWVSATVSQVIEEHLPNLEIEFRIIHPKLGIRWLQSLGSLTFDEQGEPVRLSGINLDISDRKQAELTLKQISERLQLVLEATKVGVYDWNATTNEVIWTPENEIMMGYEPGTPNRTYQEWADRVHPEDLARVELMLQTAIIQGQKDYQSEHRIIWPDGSVHWHFTLGWLTIEQGQIVKWFGTLTDIEAQKQLEVQRASLLELERTAREAAERANRIKDEFLAILSHELRSPLNPILGWTKLLQTHKFDETRTAEALATIERNAKLQTQLIDDLLDVAKILRGKLSMNVAPVNLASIIESALDTVSTAATAKSILLHPVLPNIGQVSGDSNRLQQIVWNLLSNAIKFTPKGGRVEIRLEPVNNQAHIIVSDTGIGINPDFLPFSSCPLYNAP